jgi:hypothetical protein
MTADTKVPATPAPGQFADEIAGTACGVVETSQRIGASRWRAVWRNARHSRQVCPDTDRGRTRMPWERLFDAVLEYRPEMAPLAEHGEGQLIGSGEGTVDGQRVRGALRWTLFEEPGDVVCTMNPTLAIRTDDGASIGVEGRGYAHRASKASQVWHVAATLLFSAKQERYAWLDGALGVWEGEFDAGRHTARYRAFIQASPQQDGQ